jgi:hypothetical protein
MSQSVNSFGAKLKPAAAPQAQETSGSGDLINLDHYAVLAPRFRIGGRPLPPLSSRRCVGLLAGSDDDPPELLSADKERGEALPPVTDDSQLPALVSTDEEVGDEEPPELEEVLAVSDDGGTNSGSAPSLEHVEAAVRDSQPVSAPADAASSDFTVTVTVVAGGGGGASAAPTSTAPEPFGITREMARRMVQGGAAAAASNKGKPSPKPAAGLGGSTRDRSGGSSSAAVNGNGNGPGDIITYTAALQLACSTTHSHHMPSIHPPILPSNNPSIAL